MPKSRARVGELAGIKRVIDELGAEILVSYDRQELMGTGACVVARRRVELEAMGRDGLRPRWPSGSLTRVARFAVCGAASAIDDRAVMWTGRAGQMLRATLGGCGVDVSEIAWLNMVPVACKDNPSKQQVIEWRQWAMDAIVAANVDYVLLVGATAVKCWRGDLTVEQMWLGKNPHTWDQGVALWRVNGRQVIVGASVSPWQVIRDPNLIEKWRAGIARWVGVVAEDRGIDALGMRCVGKNCVREMWAYDGDGVPYCRNHWKPDGQDRTSRSLVDMKQNQGMLL